MPSPFQKTVPWDDPLEKYENIVGASLLVFNRCIRPLFDVYEIIINDLVPGTTGTTVSFQASSDRGATFDTGNNYGWSSLESSSSGSGTGGTSGSTSIIGLGRNLTTTAGYSMGGSWKLFNPASANFKKIFGGGSVSTGTGAELQITHGVWRSNSPMNAFKIFMSSGTFSAKSIRVYGIRG